MTLEARTDSDVLRRARHGDEHAQEIVVREHLRLVHSIAKKISRRRPDVPYDDLVASGLLGLLIAIKGFKEELGYEFSTFAFRRIDGQIRDDLRSFDQGSRGLRSHETDLARARAAIEARSGEPATVEEIAKELDVSVAQVHVWTLALHHLNSLSLEAPVAGAEGGMIQDVIEDPTDAAADTQVVLEERKRRLASVIKEHLDEREQLVLALIYWEEATLKEIAAVLGVTESRVSQIKSGAVRRLRAHLSDPEDWI